MVKSASKTYHRTLHWLHERRPTPFDVGGMSERNIRSLCRNELKEL